MSLCSARRRPPTRRAIPTADIVGRVNDFGGWYNIRRRMIGLSVHQNQGFWVISLAAGRLIKPSRYRPIGGRRIDFYTAPHNNICTTDPPVIHAAGTPDHDRPC